MNHPCDLDAHAKDQRELLACYYRMLDAHDQLIADQQAQGELSLRDRIANSSVRMQINEWITAAQAELSRVARIGGHGHQVARGNS